MRIAGCIIALLFLGTNSNAQFQPIYHAATESHSWYFDSTQTHTALQPYYRAVPAGTTQLRSDRSWVARKLFEEHLVQLRADDYSLNIDFLPDMYIGSDRSADRFIWNNTRGISIDGSVQSKFSFGFQVYENQAVFPLYLDSISAVMGAVPGQGWNKPNGTGTLDYAYGTGHVAYCSGPFQLYLGNDKLFVGNGYRSLLLSDVSVPYPYLKATLDLRKIQYSAIYAQFIDRSAPMLSYDLGYRKKWGVFHYLDWKITDRFSLGLFDAIIWQDDDSTGKRGFDFSYANPVIFLRTTEYSFGSSDNALIGANLSYRLGKQTTLYGQVAFDELKVDELIKGDGWWANKFGVQLGVKSKDLLKISNLSGFSELNTVRPYTYSHWTSLKGYSHYNDALAHPMGANFIESVSRLEYRYKRWAAFLQVNYARYGADSVSGTNVGKNILLSYTTRDKEYGNKILQGIRADFIYSDLRIAYILNPVINLRLELGYVYRNERIGNIDNAANIITFGLRSSFRNLYFDR